jgi:uncharacterized protein (UPF0548 family)
MPANNSNGADPLTTQLWEQRVSYAAVGASQASDLMEYPPEGYRPLERRVRIGHGAARFQHAWITALSWGIQRNSGFAVELIDSPQEVTGSLYVPVHFDSAGRPIAPAFTGGAETIYGPDGHPLLAPGDTAVLTLPVGPFRLKAPVRVVYVVDEPKRKGFAYGTLAGHPADGEEAFIVEMRDDDSVWLLIRAFSRPSNRWWQSVNPFLRLAQTIITRRYELALAGPILT